MFGWMDGCTHIKYTYKSVKDNEEASLGKTENVLQCSVERRSYC